MQKIHKNTFTQGIDADTTIENFSKSKYKDAVGITVTADGEYSTVKARKSDEVVLELDPSEKIIKIVRCNFKAKSIITESLVLFSVYSEITSLANTDYTMNIYLYKNNTPTLIASYFIGSSFALKLNPEDLFVDSVLFTERGTDNLYFTDGITEPKKLPLDESIIDNGSGSYITR